MVANLEDLAVDLQKRSEKTQSAFETYLQSRDDYQKVIDQFDDDLAVLHQIPVFPSLLKVENSKSMVGSVVPNKPYENGDQMNLLDWINSR